MGLFYTQATRILRRLGIMFGAIVSALCLKAVRGLKLMMALSCYHLELLCPTLKMYSCFVLFFS